MLYSTLTQKQNCTTLLRLTKKKNHMLCGANYCQSKHPDLATELNTLLKKNFCEKNYNIVITSLTSLS